MPNKTSSKSNKSYKGGNCTGSAHNAGEAIYGAAGQQHAASDGSNVIAMNQIGGEVEPSSDTVFSTITASKTGSTYGGKKGKSKKGKSKKGGIGLGEVAVPALLLYANNAFGRGRKSVRLNPMSHFSKKGSKSRRRSRSHKRR